MTPDSPTDEPVVTAAGLRQQVELFVAATESLTGAGRAPLVVALDGRSGAGKSTLARAAANRLDDCAVIEGDEFYAGGSAEEWDAMTPADRAQHCIDWRRQRPVLEALRQGRPAAYFGFDWEQFDGSLNTGQTICGPADVVILDGAYSARPELADLVDLRVLLDVPYAVRRPRLVAREGLDWHEEWFVRWSSAEDHYFDHIVPATGFDLVIKN